jgi:two-component system, OmpR family, sensor histidine kinase KdpD
MHALLRSAVRICLSAGVIVLVLSGADHLRHVNSTSMALILVLMVLCIAIIWGWLEALVAALAAGLGLDYFFLPPRGWGPQEPQQWVALFVFLVTALATGQLTARSKRHRVEAEHRRKEMGKLLQLSDALLECRTTEAIAGRMAHVLFDILGAEGVAVYEKTTGSVSYSGTKRVRAVEEQLRDVAASGGASVDPKSGASIVPIRESGEPWGSVGIVGAIVSLELLMAIGERLGNAITNARLADKAKEVEIVRRSDEFKSAVFDALAHEARAPLGSIGIAVTTLLSEKPGDPAQQREMLNVIKEEMERMDRWIDETVRLSEAEGSQLSIHKVPHGLADLVAAALGALGPAVGRRLSVEIPEDLPMALCDGEATRRVVDLILDNAVKYSPPGPPIAVSAKMDEDLGMIVVTVADAGPGVPEDERERIFEKNYRGSQHRLHTPGSGLGLASAKYLVERQGGEIWVSNRLGGGAAFHFSLPVVKETRHEDVEDPGCR